MIAINIFHVLVVAPVLAYVVVKNGKGEILETEFLLFLAVLVTLMFLFHLYKIWNHVTK